MALSNIIRLISRSYIHSLILVHPGTYMVRENLVLSFKTYFWGYKKDQ